jgi:hypothetical protein
VDMSDNSVLEIDSMSFVLDFERFASLGRSFAMDNFFGRAIRLRIVQVLL